MGGERISGIFSSSSGESIVVTASPGISEIHFPSGVVSAQILEGDQLYFLVSTAAGESFAFTVDSNGYPVTSADETAFLDASAALSLGSASVIEDAYNFNLEIGYDPLSYSRIHLPPSVSCGLAVAGLVGSYFTFIPATAGGPGGWVLAIVLHEVAVIAFVDTCFGS
jgi:hypothetical protein